MEKIRYFDHAATTRTKEEVIKEMLPYESISYGNPSSIYSLGRKARKAVEEARQKVAKAIGAEAKEIYFTSCGSESDNLAIKGIAYANRQKGNHIITSRIEHPAVLHTCQHLEKQGFQITYLPVNKEGLVCVEDLKRAITKETILISIMFANNEIGTIQPIEELAQVAKERQIYFHTDAVQALGNIPIDVKKYGIDALSMSAHKFYGPKGMGALYIKTGISFEKLQDGGHQEKNKRAGTENVAGIVGMGKAIEMATNHLEAYSQKLFALRESYLSQVEEKIPNCKLNGHRIKRLPGNANISFSFVEGEALLLHLDARGICASSGSACTSGSAEPSHVLVAIGLSPEIAQSSLRVTFGEDNTQEDVDYLVTALVEVLEKLRSNSPQ